MNSSCQTEAVFLALGNCVFLIIRSCFDKHDYPLQNSTEIIFGGAGTPFPLGKAVPESWDGGWGEKGCLYRTAFAEDSLTQGAAIARLAIAGGLSCLPPAILSARTESMQRHAGEGEDSESLPPPRIVPLSISRFPSGSLTFSRGICRLGKRDRETGNGGCSRRSLTARCRLPPPADPDLQGFFRLKGAPSSCRPLAINQAKEAGQGGISPYAQPISTARAPAGWLGITGLIPAGQTCPAAETPYPYISPG